MLLGIFSLSLLQFQASDENQKRVFLFFQQQAKELC